VRQARPNRTTSAASTHPSTPTHNCHPPHSAPTVSVPHVPPRGHVPRNVHLWRQRLHASTHTTQTVTVMKVVL
jgi:hypothetical protein